MKKSYFTKFKTAALIVLFAVFTQGQMLAQFTTQAFNYTGVMQTYTVPACVSSITITCAGAQGIGVSNWVPGNGGYASGVLAVTPGQVLNIFVGSSNGYNGGGQGLAGANGGGASDVRIGGVGLTNRVIVAGGGGGAGGDSWQCNVGSGDGGGGSAVGVNCFGGAGGAGYTSGTGCGTNGANTGGNGGTGYHGGGGGGGGFTTGGQGAVANGGPAGNGQLGIGGDAQNAPGCFSGGCGAGGGGYYGGGGAAGTNCGAGRGGGGTSWTGNLTSPSFTAGSRTGDGLVTLRYLAGLVAQTSISNSLICQGFSSNLGASGLQTYTWSTGAQTASIVVTPSATTTYTLFGTTPQGCPGGAFVTVNVNPLPPLVVSNAPNVLCVGQTATLSATGALSYTWNTNAQTPVINPNPAITTNYTVQASSPNGCIATSVIAVVVNTIQLTSNPTSSAAICNGDAITLNAFGAVTYTWTGGHPFSLYNVAPTTSQNFTVVATDINGCPLSRVIAITVNPKPIVTAVLSKQTICKGESASVTAGGGSSWLWNTGANTQTINVTPPLDVPYYYVVTGTDANGCSSTATVMLTVSKCAGINEGDASSHISLFPNPNNGLLNVSVNNAGTNNVIKVYNSLGSLIRSQVVGSDNTVVDLQNEPKGIYVIHVMENNKLTLVSKMIKQ